jgi:uncharacterized membrane protein
MSDLIAIAFDDESTAFDLRAELVRLQKDYLLEMEDVVVVTRDAGGAVKLHQPVNLTAVGAAGGGFWGALIGLLFLNPLLGAAVGAGAGALSGALTDVGINDTFMKEAGQSLPPGGSAVFILSRKMTGDKVLDRLSAFRSKGRLLQTSLSSTDENAWKGLFDRATAAQGTVPTPDSVATPTGDTPASGDTPKPGSIG